MSKLSLQGAFNKVWQRFVIEKKPAGYVIPPYSDNERCIYSSRDGVHKCAIGALLPKHLLTAKVADFIGTVSSMWGLLETFPKIANYFSEINEDALSDLQKCHDDAATNRRDFHSDIKDNLIDFAADNNLTIPKDGKAVE